MRALGKVLALWAALGPPLVFFGGRGYDPRLGLVANLHQMYVFVGDAEVSLASILVLCLVLAGTGLTLWALDSGPRSRPER